VDGPGATKEGAVRRSVVIGVGLVIALQLSGSAEGRGGKATYVGGTLSIVEKTEGRLDVSDEREAVFTFKGGSTRLAYERIDSIEYGQKTGRRVGAAVVVSPLFLLSKKRKHYVTVSFQDEQGTRQGAVFEVAKGAAHHLVSTLEARSGKSVEYESDEAKRHLQKEAR
jgi:hypothetical protein